MAEEIHFSYRNRDLEPMKIGILLDSNAIAKACATSENHTIPMNFDQPYRGSYKRFRIEFSYKVMVNCRDFFTNEKALSGEIIPFAKWLARTNRFDKFYPDNKVLIAYEGGTECPLEIGDNKVSFALKEKFMIEENKLARKIALEVAYERGKEGIFAVRNEKGELLIPDPPEDQFNFPLDVFGEAVLNLESGGLLEKKGDTYRISYKGRQEYEGGINHFKIKPS